MLWKLWRGLIVVWPVIAGCTQTPVGESVNRENLRAMPIDFSGSWEMDYTRSDDAYRALKKQFRRMRGSAQSSGSRDSNSISISSSGVESILALARLAESITRPQVLEIAQSRNEIEVKRQDDFAFTCGFYDRTAQPVETAFGTELCGWDGDQLVFHVSLPGGLTVSHRMTIAPDRQKLHIATTVASTAAPAPFTLSRFYDRFEPLPSDYDCEYTLSKKKTCTPRRSGL